MKYKLAWIFGLCFSALFIPVAVGCALFVRIVLRRTGMPRLVWGSVPIINNKYWAQSMKMIGYFSETYVHNYYNLINKREDWDNVLKESFCWLPYIFKPYLAFIISLFKYDIFFISFDGFFIGGTPSWRFQSIIFKLAKKKVVVLPYGSDSYIYHRIRSTSLLHALMMSYPIYSKNQILIENKVNYWCKNADVVIPAYMGPDGFGRWDVLLPSHLFIDLNLWTRSLRANMADGKIGIVKIFHTPNHRGFKGTEFIIDAVSKLKSEGLNVELCILENVQNEFVKNNLTNEADILVEQVIATASAMNGLEGMAAGIPVIANYEDDNYTLLIRRYSYFNECPIVSASPENLANVLRKLVTRPKLRHELGKAGRQYVEKYHGLDSAQYLFGEVVEYLYGRRDTLINLYHPLLGQYPKKKPQVVHPLINNRIVN